ncbi:MAG: hypothetical protein JWM53_4861 [bacterium]|nr:hypothetical protein [bacterium]
MRRLAPIVAVAIACGPSLALAQPATDGQKAIGFVVEPHIGTTLFSFATGGLGGTSASVLNTLQGGFLLGAKINRVIVGIGFDLERVATGTTPPVGMSSSTATTAILFTPGVRVAIVRSADHRVELFAQFDLGFGTTVTDRTQNTSYFHLSYDIGPGIRFWAHRQFAVGAVTGVRGEFEFDSTKLQGDGTGGGSTSSGLTAVFASLQLTAVF